VRAEGIVETAEGPVHEIAVKSPFKKGRENNGAAETDCGPENKRLNHEHNKNIKWLLSGVCHDSFAKGNHFLI
jgi:hypothetical protein